MKRSFLAKQNVRCKQLVILVNIMPTPSPSPQQCKQSVSEKSHIFDSFLFAMMPASICYLFGLVWCVDTLFFVHVLLFANDMCNAHNVQNYERFAVTQLTDINPLNCCDGIQNVFLPSYGCYACGFDMSCKFSMKNGTSSERDKQ